MQTKEFPCQLKRVSKESMRGTGEDTLGGGKKEIGPISLSQEAGERSISKKRQREKIVMGYLKDVLFG